MAAREVTAPSPCILTARHGFGRWAVSARDEDTLIGFCGYRHFHEPPERQLIYGMTPRLWGHGLATEAARAAMRFGFEELGFARIVASTDAPNSASVRVMEKLGMTFEKRVTVNGLDTIYYTLVRHDFRSDGSPYAVIRG